MKVLAEISDKEGRVVKIVSSDRRMKDRIMELYREGYPDSFDGNDMRAIKKSIEAGDLCLVAMVEGSLVGAVQLPKWPAIQDGWLLSYIYVRGKGTGVGEMLCAVAEELLEEKARIMFTTHAGMLPDYVSSYGFFTRIGYQEWGVLPGYFRDDLWGIFFAKRNPNYPIGKKIPKNSGWCEEMIDERTGKHVAEEEYNRRMRGLRPTSKWGIGWLNDKCKVLSI